MADAGLEQVLHYVLPDSLRSLRLFEDFNEDIMDIFDIEGRDDPMSGTNSFRESSREVASTLARWSQGFEKLAASFVVDAYDFLVTADAPWTWDKLGSLSMTNETLGCTGWQERTNEMLLMASAALRNMPKLGILKIWNGDVWVASLFRYAVDEDDATLTWKYHEDVHLDDDVVKGWEEAALEHHRKILKVDCESVAADGIRSQVHAISHLGLKIPVLDSESEKQIRLEGEMVIR